MKKKNLKKFRKKILKKFLKNKLFSLELGLTTFQALDPAQILRVDASGIDATFVKFSAF